MISNDSVRIDSRRPELLSNEQNKRVDRFVCPSQSIGSRFSNCRGSYVAGTSLTKLVTS
jgi:hypothetical protein